MSAVHQSLFCGTPTEIHSFIGWGKYPDEQRGAKWEMTINQQSEEKSFDEPCIEKCNQPNKRTNRLSFHVKLDDAEYYSISLSMKV